MLWSRTKREVITNANEAPVALPLASSADDAFGKARQMIDKINLMRLISKCTGIKPSYKLIYTREHLTEDEWVQMRWECEGFEHREGLPKDGDFRKREQVFKCINKIL